MGNPKPGTLEYQFVIKQNVHIEGAGAPAFGAHSAQLVLDFLDPMEQVFRGKGGLEQGGAVEEIRLTGRPTDRPTGQPSAYRPEIDARCLPQQFQCLLEIGFSEP
jgi:hypothetical protein